MLYFHSVLKCGCHNLKKTMKTFESVRYLNKRVKTDISKIRNIGIIAHIDAGKTTTTERMLFYSGFMRSMGEVHDGDTVMDYMDQERKRGITITSAAITFNWKKHQINLIDTPGHVDFTFEVERSLGVLDGAIVVLDASAGVEVQTLKVWDQAKRYNVPSIIYLNKLDKVNSSISMCLSSIENKLKTRPLLLHYPLGKDKGFYGVVDLVTLQKYSWDKNASDCGKSYIIQPFNADTEPDIAADVFVKRENLIEAIADLDDEIANKYLTDGSEKITIQDLTTSLRHITTRKAASLTLCGSSYKNIAVQLLMDSVINYLPNPSEINFKPASDYFCGAVFKISHNRNKESLTYLRIYSGSLASGQRVFNPRHNRTEKVGKVLIPLADDFQETALATVGNIVVVTNCKDTATGDILFCSASTAEKNWQNLTNSNSILSKIQIPDPVFFCTIEPPTVGQQKQLDFALSCLQREDPTFQVETDENIGQTILKGMGELHIAVIKERILAEYGVDAFLGPLQVAYRERLEKFFEHTHILDKTVGGSRHFVKISLQVYPRVDVNDFNQVKVVVTKENNLGKIRSDYLKAVNTGVKNALKSGPILSFPVINIGVDLVWFEVGKGTSPSMLIATASQCVSAALRKSTMRLLEPLMSLTIAIEKGYSGRVLSDLSHRRSQIVSMELREDIEIIQAFTPLSELRGYSTQLRAMTAGTCSFTIDFERYEAMERNEQSKAIEIITGFAA